MDPVLNQYISARHWSKYHVCFNTKAALHWHKSNQMCVFESKIMINVQCCIHLSSRLFTVMRSKINAYTKKLFPCFFCDISRKSSECIQEVLEEKTRTKSWFYGSEGNKQGILVCNFNFKQKSEESKKLLQSYLQYLKYLWTILGYIFLYQNWTETKSLKLNHILVMSLQILTKWKQWHI